MNTFTSCGLVWYPPPADGKCPCDPDQMVRVLFKSERIALAPYVNATDTANYWPWDDSRNAGWYPVNPDGTEITPARKPARPRVLRRRFPLARGTRPSWK